MKPVTPAMKRHIASLMRFSPFDIGRIPDIGMPTLVALGVALLAPIVTTGFAGAAFIRESRVYDRLSLLARRLLFISGWL